MTSDQITIADLRPGMTFIGLKNERLILVRPLANGETVKSVPGPLENNRKNKWFVAPVEKPDELWLTRFDETMDLAKLDWQDPQSQPA